MRRATPLLISALSLPFVGLFSPVIAAGDVDALLPIKHNSPGLVVDLGVGLWALPLPMDYDGDGDNDLVVSTTNKPSSGVFFFENTEGDVKYPIFRPAVRLGDAKSNVTISHIAHAAHVLTPGRLHPEFTDNCLSAGLAIPYKKTFYAGRSNQWKICDYDGDGLNDLIIGASDWREYGWDDAFDARGEWTNGPLHGCVYFAKNTGTNDAPAYAEAEQILAAGDPLDVFGCPSPNLADWDGDGDLDIICGEFLDRLTYFENTGARSRPRYAEGRRLKHRGKTITMDLQMIVPVTIDWDKDGDTDLVVGQEDGRVALVENTGRMSNGMPVFLPPRFFRQQADNVKCGALVTPCSYDWDGDGDEDLICGDTAGYINLVENLDGGDPPRWAAPVYLRAGGKVIRIQAGPNGSIQGPAEAKWGYTAPCVADWNHDGLPDIIVNSIWGEVLWYRNGGTRNLPKLRRAQPVRVEWPGDTPKPAWNWWPPSRKQLVTQWRTSPTVLDLNDDGLNDLVMLDRDGFLALFERRRAKGKLQLLPPRQVFYAADAASSVFDNANRPVAFDADANGVNDLSSVDGDGYLWFLGRGEKTPGKRAFRGASASMPHERPLLRLNCGWAGRSGRRKLTMADWDGDGRLDLLVNSRSIDLLRNVATEGGEFVFENMGPVHPRALAGHTTCPTTVDWDRNGVPDLLVGAEDGFMYYLKNPRASDAQP
ncbi:MAG: VCBS repeat-containing protein, partial [Armatimonadota bacterium]